MAIPNITNFISRIDKHSGPAKAERYYVHIIPPPTLILQTSNMVEDLIYQCETSELPGTSLNTVDYRVIGPSRKIATLTTYNDMTLQFYCTNDFYEKPFFDSWIEYINPRNLGWDFRYKHEYAGTVEIYQLDLTDDNIIYAVRLINAYPHTVSPLTLNWSSDTVHMLSVTFAYDTFEPVVTYNNMFNNILNITETGATPFSQNFINQNPNIA